MAVTVNATLAIASASAALADTARREVHSVAFGGGVERVAVPPDVCTRLREVNVTSAHALAPLSLSLYTHTHTHVV